MPYQNNLFIISYSHRLLSGFYRQLLMSAFSVAPNNPRLTRCVNFQTADSMTAADVCAAEGVSIICVPIGTKISRHVIRQSANGLFQHNYRAAVDICRLWPQDPLHR
jgi:hypothetical protein